MKDIAGKIALVTGGASGIGLSMAKALAASGAKIALGDIDPGRLGKAARQLRAIGATVEEVEFDVASASAWEAARDQVEGALGPAQIICNNAGVGAGANDVIDLPIEHWNWSLGINLNGVFLGAKIFAKRLRELALPGHIVNTASILGLFPTAKQPAYVATKFAVLGLSEVMRIDLAADGIGVSVLCPGLVETPLRENSMALRPGVGGGGYGLVGGEGKLSERPGGMSADPIGVMVVDAIRFNRFYVFPHPEYRESVEHRVRCLLRSFREPAQAGYREDPRFLAGESHKLFDDEL
jgi:NAD(P)-dependent dehydrogenase (short-subunit alcohol dehydrogenase family)